MGFVMPETSFTTKAMDDAITRAARKQLFFSFDGHMNAAPGTGS